MASRPAFDIRPAAFTLPRGGGASLEESDVRSILYAFDFEDGVLPAAFRQGWVGDCAPGNASRHCLLGTVSADWGSVQGVELIPTSNPCTPIFSGPFQVTISFDYWMGKERKLLQVSGWCPAKNAQYTWDTSDVLQEKWGHAEIRLMDFGPRWPGQQPPLEATDSFCTMTIRAGRPGGKPLYVDNLRITDHHTPGGLPRTSLANATASP